MNTFAGRDQGRMLDRKSMRSLRYYNAFGARRISGWFSRLDAAMFTTLLLFQRSRGIRGGTAEIGVHEGKSFIPLCLALADDERAICIDVFEDQDLNVDGSGRGSLSALRRNLAAYRIPEFQVDVLKASSLGLPSKNILDRAGPLRFISIDGGHWQEIVENDLELARLCAAPGQIIALDDFFDVDWPGVTAALMAWFHKSGHDYCPLAVTPGKLYLCHRNHYDLYKSCLVEHLPIIYHLKKTTSLFGFDTLILSGPQSGVRGRLSAWLRTYQPRLYEITRTSLHDRVRS